MSKEFPTKDDLRFIARERAGEAIKLRSENASLRAVIGKLVGALKPFGSISSNSVHGGPLVVVIAAYEDGDEHCLDRGTVERAQAALKKAKEAGYV